MATTVSGSWQTPPSPVFTTSPLARNPGDASSSLANGLSTQDKNETRLSLGSAIQGPVHLKTPTGFKVFPKDVKEAVAKKVEVRMDNLSPKNGWHGQPLKNEVPDRYDTHCQVKTTKSLAIFAHRSPPSNVGPLSSPRSLKKFALGLRQSRSLGRGPFSKEDWSSCARQRKQEKPQVSQHL